MTVIDTSLEAGKWKGWEVPIDDDRSAIVYKASNGYGIVMKNGDQETKLALTVEATDALIHALLIATDNRGPDRRVAHWIVSYIGEQT